MCKLKVQLREWDGKARLTIHIHKYQKSSGRTSEKTGLLALVEVCSLIVDTITIPYNIYFQHSLHFADVCISLSSGTVHCVREHGGLLETRIPCMQGSASVHVTKINMLRKLLSSFSQLKTFEKVLITIFILNCYYFGAGDLYWGGG